MPGEIYPDYCGCCGREAGFLREWCQDCEKHLAPSLGKASWDRTFYAQLKAENRIWWIKPSVEITRADQVIHWPLDAHGKYWRGWLVATGIKLDLFLTTPETWGATFLIRTGPTEYNTRIVSECRPQHYFADGKLLNWEGKLVPTPEEQSVYDALGLKFVRPDGLLQSGVLNENLTVITLTFLFGKGFKLQESRTSFFQKKAPESKLFT